MADSFHTVKQDTAHSLSHSRERVNFYRRKLPRSCVPFSSEEGRKIFTEALRSGHMRCYFRLAEQFRTQDELICCGLSTLVMVLNTLGVDPGKMWKSPWRWYHEDMLDRDCVKFKERGTDLDEIVRLCVCNHLEVKAVRPTGTMSVENFREALLYISQRDDEVMICNYSRIVMAQVGIGHFSPIGGYHPERDLVLVFDVARFKYPPYWAPVTRLWEAMQDIDVETGLSRGYILARKDNKNACLITCPFSRYLTVPIQYALHGNGRETFFQIWNDFLGTTFDCNRQTIMQLLDKAFCLLISGLGDLKESIDQCTTEKDLCFLKQKSNVHICMVHEIIPSLEKTLIFRKLNDYLSGDPFLPEKAPISGRGFVFMTCCGHHFCDSMWRIDFRHFITLLLLGWCYPSKYGDTQGDALYRFMMDQFDIKSVQRE